jgi:hypothetical protein
MYQRRPSAALLGRKSQSLPVEDLHNRQDWTDKMGDVMTDLKEPNRYELSRDDIELTYSTTSIDGSARFSFRDAGRKFDFSGEQIRTRATDLGTEMTVTLENIPDAQTVTLTLLVPAINLGQKRESQFDTAAIETTNHTTIAGPKLVTGPLQTYRVIELHGTAKIVQS